MNARDAILAGLRAQVVDPVALPPLTGEWVRYTDPVEQFCAAVGQAAGSVVPVSASADVTQVISELDVVRQAMVRCSLVSGVQGNFAGSTDPHAFRHVDVLIVAAELGVAENGAVWIGTGAVKVRAALFLAQHLVVLLPRAEIVDNLHQAYERIGAALSLGGYGCFISGPSKTADIEQALVVGAHGPRSLTIVLCSAESLAVEIKVP